ncbi:MAG: PQQ-dependent sugar dehydrogenase, partial [Anaerolineae bacterium]|nr:PQQ-dependent sugar dehydrogenase [Anaerolineae bacterium]
MEATSDRSSSATAKYGTLMVSLLVAMGLATLGLIALSDWVLAAPGDITGTVTYYGSRPGTIGIQLSVFTTTVPPAPPAVATGATSTDIGAYTIVGVEEGTYYVFTYLDLDNDSDYDPGLEPYAWYDYEGDGRADSVTVTAGGTTRGIDILLTDLWQPLGGPMGQVNAIVAQPGISGTLYASVGGPYSGRNSTVYKSTDGAATWTAIYTGSGNTLQALAVTGTLVYGAGETPTGQSVIVQSLDAGDTWTQVFAGGAQDASAFRDLAIDPMTTTTAYAVGYRRGPGTGYANRGVVYRTPDNGATWVPVHTVPESDLLAVAVNPVTPTLVYAGGYYKDAGTHYAALFRSNDGGDTWTEVLTGTYGPNQQFTDIVVHPTTPTLVYAGTQTDKAIYRSEDTGLTWTEVYTDRGFRLALDPPTTVYATDDYREVAVSTANGDLGSWIGNVAGALTPGFIEALAIDGVPSGPADPVLYLGFRERGIYRSDDGGLTWAARNQGIVPTTAPRHIEVDPQNQDVVYVATGCDGGWRTADHGQSWDRLLGDCVETFAVHPQSSGVVYAGISGSATKAVERSEDGLTFASSYAGSADIVVIDIARSNTNVVLGGGEDAGAATLVRSLDGGATWSEVFSQTDAGVTAVAIHPADETIALMGATDRSGATDVAVLYRTTDGGDTWIEVYRAGVASGAIHSLVIDQQQPNVVYATDDFSVLKSVDGGATWLPPLLPFGEANRNLLAIDPRLADHVYLVGPGYIAETIDGGANWSDWSAPINQGTEGRTATALAVSQGGITQTLYAGFSGVWSYTRPSPQTSDFTTERVLGGLAQPTAIDWAPDGRMFIAHQSGLVLVTDGGTPTTFVDISDEVNNNWNRGLIGIAVHPKFPTEPYVYLLYTYDPPGLPGPDGAVDGKDGNGARVSRLLRVEADPAEGYNAALPATVPDARRVLLGKNSTLANLGDPADAGGDLGTNPACTSPGGSAITDCLPSEGPSHSVGAVVFGRDGNLWVTNGEGAPYITPDYRAGRAQDVDSLGGKVLRIDPDTGEGLPDNPFYNGDPTRNRSRVWAMGLRNPFRVALHPEQNVLYVGDVGWFAWEELNYGGEGYNFGWPCYEGGASGNLQHALYNTYAGTAAYCQPLYDAEPNNGIEAPAYAYQNIAGAAIVAGDFYTGTRYPARYQNALFIADYDKRTITTLTFDDAGATANLFLENVSALGGPVDLRLGPDGYLYYVALNPDPAGESEIRRVLYTSAPTVEINAAPRYGNAPLDVQFSSTLSGEAEAGTLAYAWTFGDGGTSAETDPLYRYENDGTYTSVLTVTTPQGKSSHDQIAIVVGNSPPAVTIDTPVTGTTYTISTTLAFNGSATDPDTGPVPAAALRWRAQWFYNGHLHPAFFSLDGQASGSFTVPAHNDNTSMFLCLTAVDDIPELLDPTTCVELHPQTVPYRFESAPESGYTLTY